jgi:hypothetical protein
MKYIAIIFIFLCFACNDSDFLNQRPHTYTAETVFNTPEGALEALNGIYDILQTQQTVARFEMLGEYMSPDVMYTGEPGGNDSPYQARYERFIQECIEIADNDYWDSLFTGIYRCNLLLEILNDTENLFHFDEMLRQRIIGETLFLRGLIEFKLLIVFAGEPQLQQDFSETLLGLPFYDHVPAPDEYFKERPSLESSWQRVEDDFQQAIPLLPLKSEYTPEDMGRATKGSAQAMLAKTCLFTEQWQKAFDAAEAVIQSGEYGLVGDDEHPGPFAVQRTSKEGMVTVEMPAFKWMFQPEGDNNVEDIFSIVYTADHSSVILSERQEGNQRPNEFGPRRVLAWNADMQSYISTEYFWGLYQPTPYFVETAYKNIGCMNEAGEILDPRYKFTVIAEGDSVPYFYADESIRMSHPDSVLYDPWSQWPCPPYSMWKYFSDPIFRQEAVNFSDYPHDIHYFRYADLLLIDAEAAMHIDKSDKALEYTNRVRSRARYCGTTGYPKNLEYISLEDVYNERRVELAFEGHAFFDMVRTRRIKSMLDEATEDYGIVQEPVHGQMALMEWGDNFTVGKNEILPIPCPVIESSNGTLSQNPGYDY